MANFSEPSLHDVTQIHAQARLIPAADESSAVLRLTFDGSGERLVLPIFLPRHRFAYAERIAAAINAVPVDEPIEQPSEDRRVPRYPEAAE